MSEEEADHRKPEVHSVSIKAAAKVSVKMDAILITLEQQLEPVFQEMDMARLYRISQGEELNIPGVGNAPKEPAKLIARHWYDKRLREEDHALAKRTIEVAERGLRISLIAIVISGVLAFVAILNYFEVFE